MMTGESDAGRSTGSKPETAMWPIIMLSTEWAKWRKTASSWASMRSLDRSMRGSSWWGSRPAEA